MHDREDDNEDTFPVTADAVEDLKTITYLLKGLYGRLKQEQEAISLACGQMSFSAEQFNAHMERIEAFEKAYRKYVADTVKDDLRQSAKLIAHEISQQVAATVNNPVEQSLSNLRQLTDRVGRAFDQQVKDVSRIKRWTAAIVLGLSLVSGLLGGLAVHYYLPETNEATNRQMLWGGVLMNAVPHLSKQEKDKIIKLGVR